MMTTPESNPLSFSQLQILHHVALGKSNREIADHLSTTAYSVKTCVRGIITRLDVADRTAAAIWYVKNAHRRSDSDAST